MKFYWRPIANPHRQLSHNKIYSTFTTAALVFSALFFINSLAPATSGQTKRKTPSKTAPVKTDKTKSKPETPGDELARLRKEFIEANKEYQELLKKQLVGLERNVVNAEEKLAQSQKLFAEGLISKRELEVGERAVAQAKDEVAEVNRRLGDAETEVAHTLLEAETEVKLRRSRPLPRGGMLSTAALIRYNGAAGWALSDSWKVQRFFMDAFKKPLPIAVFGQGAIHDRWRLDHRNSMDVSLHPDGPEGQALLNFLRANGIPFLAFRSAIPGTATGPHIHVGRPSHRY